MWNFWFCVKQDVNHFINFPESKKSNISHYKHFSFHTLSWRPNIIHVYPTIIENTGKKIYCGINKISIGYLSKKQHKKENQQKSPLQHSYVSEQFQTKRTNLLPWETIPCPYNLNTWYCGGKIQFFISKWLSLDVLTTSNFWMYIDFQQNKKIIW